MKTGRRTEEERIEEIKENRGKKITGIKENKEERNKRGIERIRGTGKDKKLIKRIIEKRKEAGNE